MRKIFRVIRRENNRVHVLIDGIEFVFQTGYKDFKKNILYSAEIKNENGLEAFDKIVDLDARYQEIEEIIEDIVDHNKRIVRDILKYELEEIYMVDWEIRYKIQDKIDKMQGLDEGTKKDIKEKLKKYFLIEQLKGYAISEEGVRKAVKDYDTEILEKPWLLIDYGAKYKDIITRLQTEKKLSDILNIKLATYLVVWQETYINNKICMPYNMFFQKLKSLLHKNMVVEEAKIEEILNDLNEVVIESIDGTKWIYLRKYWNLEVELANMIRNLSKRQYKVDVTQICSEQILFKQAVCNALGHAISIITGGAGTGKTTLIGEIVKNARQMDESLLIKVVTPTGMATERITEELIEGDIEISTIHRFLKINRDREQAICSVTVDVLIIDEASMVNLELFVMLISAVEQNENIRVVVIGDEKQLPAIDPGQVLKKLINVKGIMHVELTKIYRQTEGNAIIDNALKISKGDSGLTWEKGEFEFVACPDADINKRISEILKKHIKQGEDLYKIQIISAKKEGEGGTNEINKLVQRLINEEPNKRIGIADKVMHIENNYVKNIFNGQMGLVVERTETIDKTEVMVRYTKDEIKYKDVIYTNEELSQVEVAFATTVHKMQGNAEKIVIFVVPKMQKNFLSRELLYVGVTRAQSKVIVVGNKEAFNSAIGTAVEEDNCHLVSRIEN